MRPTHSVEARLRLFIMPRRSELRFPPNGAGQSKRDSGEQQTLPPRSRPRQSAIARDAVREMSAGMRAADVVVQALASVVTSVACETSRNRDTARAIVLSDGKEMVAAVDQAERLGRSCYCVSA